MFKVKKGISPIVTIALFLVIVVIAVVSLQTWFQSLQNASFGEISSHNAPYSTNNDNIVVGNGITISSSSALLAVEGRYIVTRLSLTLHSKCLLIYIQFIEHDFLNLLFSLTPP